MPNVTRTIAAAECFIANLFLQFFSSIIPLEDFIFHSFLPLSWAQGKAANQPAG
jgi:hypothetical protein